METGTTANSRLKDAVYLIRKLAITAAGAATVAGIGFLAYAAFHLNSENVRRSVMIEETGQRVEYFERTPRMGILRWLPWNDDNGHAIINFYSNETLEMRAYDEDLNGGLFGRNDRLELILKNHKKVTCFSGSVVNSNDVKTEFGFREDPIDYAENSAAAAFCLNYQVRADIVYETVRQAVRASK